MGLQFRRSGTARPGEELVGEQVQKYLAEINWEEWSQCEDPYTEVENTVYKTMVDSARRMKAKGFTEVVIAEITGLSVEEVRRI